MNISYTVHWLIGGCGGPETHLWQGMVDSQPLNKIHRMPASLAKNVKFLHPWSWKHKYWQFSALFILRFSDSMAMTFSTTNGQTVPLFTKSQVSCMPFVMARKLKKDNMILTMSSFTCWRYSLLNWHHSSRRLWKIHGNGLRFTHSAQCCVRASLWIVSKYATLTHFCKVHFLCIL